MQSPNKNLILMEFFLNPEELQQYMQDNCRGQLIYYGPDMPRAAFYVRADYERLDESSVLSLCTGVNGAWDTYHQYVVHFLL